VGFAKVEILDENPSIEMEGIVDDDDDDDDDDRNITSLS
jgi:hypothetical protein